MQWEYRIVYSDHGKDLVQTLNEQGKNGWELASADYDPRRPQLIFKRHVTLSSIGYDLVPEREKMNAEFQPLKPDKPASLVANLIWYDAVGCPPPTFHVVMLEHGSPGHLREEKAILTHCSGDGRRVWVVNDGFIQNPVRWRELQSIV